MVDLSLKKTVKDRVSWDTIKQGDLVYGAIHKVSNGLLMVQLESQVLGRVVSSDIDYKVLADNGMSEWVGQVFNFVASWNDYSV